MGNYMDNYIDEHKVNKLLNLNTIVSRYGISEVTRLIINTPGIDHETYSMLLAIDMGAMLSSITRYFFDGKFFYDTNGTIVGCTDKDELYLDVNWKELELGAMYEIKERW